MGSAFRDSEVTRRDRHTGQTALLVAAARALGALGRAACRGHWWGPVGLGLGLGCRRPGAGL